MLRSSLGVAGLLMALARAVWGTGGPTVRGAWEELTRRRARFTAADAALTELISSGVRWLLHPADGTPPPADAVDRITTRLGLPEALAASWALDDTVVIDVPVAIGMNPDLRIDRFGDFDTRLGLVGQALDQLRATRAVADAAVTEAFEAFDAATGGTASNPTPAAGGAALDLAGLAPVPSLVSFAVRTLPRVVDLARRGRNRLTRGPPGLGYAGWFAGRYGAGRRLRLVVGLATPIRDQHVTIAREALAANRVTRQQTLTTAGGVVAVLTTGPGAAGFVDLAIANTATQAAVTARDAALESYAVTVRPAVERAARDGLPLRLVVLLTGLSWEQVSEFTRRFVPDPGERTRWVDPLTERWINFWGWRHPATDRELTLANGDQVTTTRLDQIITDIDGGRGGYQLVMLVGDQVAGMIGRDRMALYDLSDGHFHHIGYDDPRNTRLEGFLTRLQAAGHQGVITFHPIPQRGMGLATLGGSFYYALANVLTLGLLFNQQMLQMWGKFPDVRLLDAVRALPDQLRWRAVMGVVGARMDVPGALGYLRLMAVLNPDLAGLVGETTIAKEAVTDLLGDQAIRTINPDWAHLVQRLVAAVGLLRQALRDGDLDPARLTGIPAELATLITVDHHTDPVAVAAGLAEVLVEHIEPIAELLGASGHPRASGELHTARSQLDAGLLPMYNPHLRELLQASSEVGYLVVLHNDFGLARIAGNGRFADVTPDERFGAPLLALLAEYGPESTTRPVVDGYRPAKIILAHLGVGKFTTVSVQHLELIDQILSDPRYDHVSFDISWNEVTRHLLADRAIADRFIDLVREHPDRFVFGSDAVKPESNAQYFRQHHDLEPIWERIRDEVGLGALANIRYRVLETRLADARRDVAQWVFNELSDPTSRAQWNHVLALMDPPGPGAHPAAAGHAGRQQIPLDWFNTQQALGQLSVTAPGVGPDYQLPDDTVLPDGTRMMHWRDNRQVQSLIRWHNAVTPDVVAGRRLSLRLIGSALKASWVDLQNERDDRRAARDARRQAKRFELDAAVHTGELALLDAEGAPYTVQALIAAGQTGAATNPTWARRVLELTQESELRQIDDRTQRDHTARRLLIHTAIAAGVFAAVVGIGGWQLWPLLTTSTAGYVQFAIRGGLGLHRGAYSQQMRVLVESILERGQLNTHTVRRLIETMRKYAIFDRATPRQIANFDGVANEFLVIAHVLERELQTANGETAQIRHETALELFSIFLDKAGNALGAQAQSFHGLNPHGGVLGRLLNTTLALTFVINAFGHIHGALTQTGFAIAVNAAYAVADLLFLSQAGPSAVTGWAGWDIGAHAIIRKLVHRLALPVITIANLLLTIQLAFITNSAMVIPALTLTLSSGYLTILGLISEGKLGRLSPRRGAFANAVLNASLMAFGVITLLPTHWPQLLAAAIGAPIAVYAVAKLDRWLSLRTRAPPPDQQQLTELSTRLAEARARLASAPKVAWDASRMIRYRRLLPELDRVDNRLTGLRRASHTVPIPAHQLDRATTHVETALEQLDTLLSTGGGTGAGGTVAVGPREPARQAMLGTAAVLYQAGRTLDPDHYPGQPRGPPVAVRLVPAHLRPAGAEGVVAFGWKHPVLAPEGVVLIFEDTFAEILEHIAAGRLAADWWNRLLVHERDFHLLGDVHTGHRHDRDADPIADELLAARTPGQLSRSEAELVAEALLGLWDRGRQAFAAVADAVSRAVRFEPERPESLRALVEEVARHPGWIGEDLEVGLPERDARAWLTVLVNAGLITARGHDRRLIFRVTLEGVRLLARLDARAGEPDPVRRDLLDQVAELLETTPTAGLAATATRLAPLLAAVGTTQAATMRWWRELSPDDRREQLMVHSLDLGDLDGIPAEVRHEINLSELKVDEASLTKRLRLLPRRALITSLRTQRELTALRAKLTGIRKLLAELEANPELLLLGYDIGEGQGHATIAVNNPDTSDHVAVFVPGMRYRFAKIDVPVRRAQAMHRAAIDAGARNTSVIAWGHLEGWPQSIPTAGRENAARRAAPQLHSFLEGLRATHQDGLDLHLTLVAHSYATVLAGITAATAGLPIDDLVLLASPGTTLDHAAQFHLPEGHAWAGTATRDPILTTPLRWHNMLPTDPRFGATVFDAGTGGNYGLVGPHANYWEPNSPALPNVGRIIAGNYDQVRHAPAIQLPTQRTQPPGRTSGGAQPRTTAPSAPGDSARARAPPLWLRIVVAVRDRVLGGREPRRRRGGPARISGEGLSDAMADIVARVIARLGWTEVLTSPAEIDRFAGLDNGEAARAVARGVRIAAGFNTELRRSGGPQDLVIYAGSDGWLYTDARTWAALHAGALDPDALRQLFRHELAELTNAHLPRAQRPPHDQLPALPDLSALAEVVGAPPVPRRGHAIAYDVSRRRVELVGTPLTVAEQVLVERFRAGAVEEAGEEATRTASPTGLWGGAGMRLLLVDELNERLAVELDTRGLAPVTIVYLSLPGSRVVYADRALFLTQIQHLPEPARRYAERHEFDHATHPDPDHREWDVWEADPPTQEVDAQLISLARVAIRGVFVSRRVRQLVADAVRQVETAALAWETGQVDVALRLLAPATAMLEHAREELADPHAWPLRVDDRVGHALVWAGTLAAALLEEMRTPAVAHRIGQRVWAALERDRLGHAPDPRSLAVRVGAPIELVRDAIAAHPGLRMSRVDGRDQVSISGWGRVPVADPVSDAVGLVLPGTLDPDGSLTALAELWLVGEHRPLRDFERSRWLTELVIRTWLASAGPVMVIGRTEVYQARVPLPAGLRLLGPDASAASVLELVVHRSRHGVRRLVNVYPVVSSEIDTPARPAAPPADSVVAIRDGVAPLGTGWAIAPDLVLAPLSLLADRELSEVTVGGVAPAEVFAFTPDSFGPDSPLAEYARQLGRALLDGRDLGSPDLVVMWVPTLHATGLPLATETPAVGERLLVAARDQLGVARLILAPVVAAGPVSITLAAPVDFGAMGAPLLTVDGRVAGMIIGVDPETGLTTALAAPLLAAAGRAGRLAARAAGSTPSRLLDDVELRLRLAASLLQGGAPRSARRELRRVETALDHAAAELGPRRASPLGDADHEATFARLRTLGRQWWWLLGAARGTPADLAAARLAARQAHALDAARDVARATTGRLRLDTPTVARLAEAAIALGQPRSWRVHAHDDYGPDRSAEIDRALRLPATGRRPVGVDPELAHHGLGRLLDQLPAPLADPLATLLRHWVDPRAPPAGLPAYLAGELPRQVPGLAGPALAAVHHYLRQLRSTPGESGRRPGPGATLAIIIGVTVAGWALPALSGRGDAAEAATRSGAGALPLATAAHTGAGAGAVVVLVVAVLGYFAARWAGRAIRHAAERLRARIGESARALGRWVWRWLRWVVAGAAVGFAGVAGGQPTRTWRPETRP
ncbi:MAG TPA: alpha/beta hydrolase [Pseudonocardia sp.]|nr:alpha/beta hydrolase [Pseudonocardia sp.]